MMKYIKYLIIALTAVFAASCADEAPYSVGTLDPKATVSQITATTATINIDLSGCSELLNSNLRYNDYGLYYKTASEASYDNYKWLDIINTDGTGVNLRVSVTLTGLEPSTKYQFAIGLPGALDVIDPDSDDYYSYGEVIYTCQDFTFTTAAEGDYSALAGIHTTEVLMSNNLAILSFNSSFEISAHGIIISENPDLSNPLVPDESVTGYKGYAFDKKRIDDYYSSHEWEYIIAFNGLKPNTTYYWSLTGDFSSDNINLADYRTDVASFTTFSKPNVFFDQYIPTFEFHSGFLNDECIVKSYFSGEAANYNRYVIFSESADFESFTGNYYDSTKLKCSTEYYYAVRLYSNDINSGSGSIHLSEYFYIPENNVIRTPDPEYKNSESDPASVSQLIEDFSSGTSAPGIWVKGYIVGFMNNQYDASFSASDASNTNILLADSPYETNSNKCMAVQLPSGSTIRSELSLGNHPENLGRQLQLCGTVAQYYGSAGLKDVSSYKFLD